MLLVDSGGQYDIGTTDVTRTMHLGEPTAWQRECFTRVLKGHIGLATAVFPEGAPHISPVSPLNLPCRHAGPRARRLRARGAVAGGPPPPARHGARR